MYGKRLFVTAMGYGSTSDAHTGSMPHKAPAKGNPPEPSNRLPSLYVLFMGVLLFLLIGQAFKFNRQSIVKASNFFDGGVEKFLGYGVSIRIYESSADYDPIGLAYSQNIF
jgi:hypothetical protein